MNNKKCEICSEVLVKQQERFCSKKCQHLGHRVKNPVWNKEKQREYTKQYRIDNKDRLLKLNRIWCSKNREHVREENRKERDKLKLDILNHYSNGKLCCANCEFNDTRALQVDHIKNNGAEERRKLFGNRLFAGTTFYRWVRRNNYPEGYAILCANCNIIKLREFEKTQWK